ncbi:alpha/beta fold hydrolase [Mesonia maritima]|uniref:Pimeloyl-ACP methyl ester carboxylesterase n=1 Tax=Mesonia maritima TaxID=1793873 RepID=A0ABU1K3M8_9FLAO|nr:alpha/beta fold hydrolase [Mesonia maritima]MDR6300206.1 pimeloyl-ACP methyl ester carboxylesterase [Mesonia maritima]
MKLHSNIIGEGKPFLILHGFLGMGDNWKTLAKKFADEGYQVHLIDQRNHGRSPHTEEFSYKLMAEDIQEYCKTHNLEEIILLGHSMGGKTAMKVAVMFPELLKELIIVDIAPKYYPPHHQTILEGLTMLSDSELTSRGEADEKLQEYIEEWGVRQFLLKNLYWKEKNKLALRMNLPVLKEKIENVGIALEENEIYPKQTLFINGEKSGYIKEEDRDLINKHFPKSNLATIKGAGHWVHAEKMDEFYEIVIGYLKNLA